ncbi:MAG: hypothetical protein ABIO16_02225, partial [Nocardioides sp.]
MGDRGPATRAHVVTVLVALIAGIFAGLGTVLTPTASLATPPASLAHTACTTGGIRADRPVARFRHGDCRLVGRRVSHGPLTARIPSRGHGVVLSGLSRRGEWSLDVRTRRDGVIVVRTGSPPTRTTASALAPVNDTLASATALPVPWSVTGSTLEATADADDQAAAGACDAADLGSISSTSPSVWYTLTAPSDMVLVPGLQVTASTSDYGYDVNAYLDVFTRDSAGSLVALACGLPDITTTPRLLAGHAYYLQVFSNGGTADFVLSGRPPNASELPPNDAFVGATALPLDKKVVVANYDRASLEAGEPSPPCGPAPTGSVWFAVDAGAWRRLALLEPLYDETVTLWRGDGLGSLSSLGCFAPPLPSDGPTSYPNRAHWVVPDAGPFYLQVAQVSATSRVTETFQVTSNDSCSGGCLPPCKIRDFKLEPNTAARAPWRWSFNAAGGLAGLSARQVLRSVKAGAKVITSSKNDCGLRDKVSARTQYVGTTHA